MSEGPPAGAATAGDGVGVTPAGVSASLSVELLQQVIDAAREDAPNETVGLLIAPAYAHDGGTATRYLRLGNAAASPYRYALEPDEQVRVLHEIEARGEVVWGIVHSHLRSTAVPSASDLGEAYYPDSLYLICSLAGEMPEVRAWSLHDGEVSEVALAVG